MAYIYDLSDTWNAIGTTFKGIALNVTDTASASGSLLMDLQVGGVSQLSVAKNGSIATPLSFTIAPSTVGNGNIVVAARNDTAQTAIIISHASNSFAVHLNASAQPKYRFNASSLTMQSNLAFSWAAGADPNTVDLSLLRDAANTLAQRNGVNAQAFNLYNTYTDASNYERGFMKWNTNVLEIGTQAAGTGVLRQIRFAASAVELSSGVVFVQSDFNQSIKLHNSYGIAWGAGGVNAGSGNVTRLSTTLSSGYGVELTTGLYLGAPVLRATTGYTVATLPTTPVVGMTTRVTDATSPTVGSTVTGGGAAAAMCWYNGTNWTVIGV